MFFLNLALSGLRTCRCHFIYLFIFLNELLAEYRYSHMWDCAKHSVTSLRTWMIFCDVCFLTESLLSNAVVRYMQCKCAWPILSQTFLLVGMCALLFSINILMLVCFWNKYLAEHVKISNFWQPVFLSLIGTGDLKCYLRFRPSNFLQCLWNKAVIWEPV